MLDLRGKGPTVPPQGGPALLPWCRGADTKAIRMLPSLHRRSVHNIVINGAGGELRKF